MSNKEVNPLLEAYISEKEKETYGSICKWAHVLRQYYEAFIEEGFTDKQAM